MNGRKPLFVLAISLAILCSFSVSSILIEKNAYKGISVSFSKSVHEENFKKLKEVLVRSSELLYHATRKRSYFGEFIISLPKTFGDDLGDLCEPTSESPSKVDIHLDDWTNHYSTLTTKHSGGCGKEGDIIYMPVHWLKNDKEDLAHQFVKQWSMYRYGVFEEEPTTDGSCYMSENNWSPVGCYNVKINVEAVFENGVPVCFFPTDFFNNKKLKSSLMSQSNSSEILNFCDGSEAYPHNPSLPTLHNNLCEGKTVWSVIESSDDFKYGRNVPVKSDGPPSEPVFKCFKEQPIQVTFAIQNNTKKDLSYDMVELGYFLYQYLGNIVPSQTKANIVMFSDVKDNSSSVNLDLQNLKELEKIISKTVKTYEPVQSTCLSCGFQKALDASLEHSHPSPIAILIAWKSTLIGENPSQLAESVQSFPPNVRLHLILVEDTATEVLHPALVDAVRTTGGNIYSLPKAHVFMASKLHVILAGVVRNHLQVEDNIVVVHESVHNSITNSFIDSFSTPSNIAAQMLMYNIYCDWGNIKEENPNCTKEKSASLIFKCGEVLSINDPSASMRTWEYSFEYLGGTIQPNCSSVAILRLSPSSKKASTLRGWLNKYQIDVGRDALIIYAEMAGSSYQRNVVFTTVSSSALESPITIELLDNGNGDPDVKSGDGIYSRYFSSFTKKGIYVVSISAEVLDGNANAAKANEKKVPGVVQKKIIGSFSVNEDKPDVDIFPPNRIVDLRVVSMNHENSTVTLQWTAPGDDYDFGKATSYEIKYSEHSASLSELYFNDDVNSLLQFTNSYIPSESGTTENFEFDFSKINSGSPYYTALRAIDASKNKGKISNIVQVYFNQSQEIVTETYTNPTGISSLGSTVPENRNNTKDENNATAQTPKEFTDVSEITTSTTDTTLQPENEIFDRKFIIVISSAGGILLVIIILNVVVCFCCIKKKKRYPETKTLSKKTSLRPPYNLNIAYQDDSDSSHQTNNEGVSMSTLERNVYTEPGAINRAMRQRYTYHTDKSIQNKENLRASSELGFKLVEALPPYATSSLSRFTAKLNNPDSETDTELSSAQTRKLSDIDDAQLYPLGIV